MRVSKSSANSRHSKGVTIAVIAALAAAGIAAAAWCVSRGYSLYDGDAESHLDIARAILDSRTPGPEQLGSVWLPFPHLLMMPFAARDAWWHSGAAGAIPGCACFILTGLFLFASARRIYGAEGAGIAAALIFALNPSMLYLQSTAMTEPIQLAAVTGLLWTTLWFSESQSARAALAAGIASNVAALTRYESWFLIPFVSLYLLAMARRKSHALLFMLLAGIGPAAWLAHNRYYNGDPLAFYNGPYSALALLKRQAAGGLHYPTDHNWAAAAAAYWAAARLVVGPWLLALGGVGAVIAMIKRAWWPLAMLALVPVFFVWSLHSGGAVLTLPELGRPGQWSLYNTRYAIAVLPLAAMAAGALVVRLPARFQAAGAIGLAVAASLAMWFAPSICWEEAKDNSEVRRAWTIPAGEFLARRYRPESGVIFTFGSGLAEVLRRADIPLRQGLHEGNGPAWDGAMVAPGMFLREEWALTIPGDTVEALLMRAEAQGVHYELQRQISVKGAPRVRIYWRQSIAGPNPVH